MSEPVKQRFHDKYPFFGFRLYPEERKKLDSLAEQAHISKARVIKLLLESATVEQLTGKGEE